MVRPTALFQAALFTTRHNPFLRNFARRSRSASSAALSLSTTPSPISVFDNVLSPACRAELTTDALYNIGPDVYRRDQGTASPQDVLIESILSNLGGGFERTREVEWWGKSIYESVEAHRDVDEEAASARGERRYPTHSLIVYLDIEGGVRAPTCVWVPTGEDDDDHDNDDHNGRSAMMVVPAIPGRLLVFSGELLHAVPCPALRWLDPVSSISPRGSGPDCMRRVLVLNLWDDHAPEDEEFDYEDWDTEEDEEEDEDEIQEPIEFFAKRVECEPRQNWQPLALQWPLAANDDSTPCSSLPTLTLSTRSHGSDEPLLSPLEATSHAAVAQILESESTPRWLRTGANVRDLGIGVPSLAGSREERIVYD